MKFTYKPEDGDDDAIKMFGKTFEAGKAVEVDDERQIAKLKGNPYFTSPGKKSDDNEAEKDPEPESDLPSGLRAKAASVGVVVDKRWGETRLIQEIEKAEEAQRRADVQQDGLAEAAKAKARDA